MPDKMKYRDELLKVTKQEVEGHVPALPLATVPPVPMTPPRKTPPLPSTPSSSSLSKIHGPVSPAGHLQHHDDHYGTLTQSPVPSTSRRRRHYSEEEREEVTVSDDEKAPNDEEEIEEAEEDLAPPRPEKTRRLSLVKRPSHNPRPMFTDRPPEEMFQPLIPNSGSGVDKYILPWFFKNDATGELYVIFEPPRLGNAVNVAVSSPSTLAIRCTRTFIYKEELETLLHINLLMTELAPQQSCFNIPLPYPVIPGPVQKKVTDHFTVVILPLKRSELTWG
jgi:hypothetical protein